MKNKLVVQYSGWFEIDADDVKLTDISGNEAVTKAASEWLAERGNIDGLLLESFTEAHNGATDGEFTELDLEIEES